MVPRKIEMYGFFPIFACNLTAGLYGDPIKSTIMGQVPGAKKLEKLPP